MNGALLSLGVALVAVTASQAAPVSVGELLSDLDRFRDRPVIVSGTISQFREHVTRTGTRYYTFDFSDGTQTVRVTAFEKRDELLAQRRRLRDERSRSIVGEIQTWALAQRALPESSLGKAIGYLLGLWRGLTRFLDDPRIPLDNNRTERGLRGVVLGRKNHYGSRSRRGLDVAALFYSLIESAKVCGVEPKAYLRHAMRAALADRAAVTLPHTLLT